MNVGALVTEGLYLVLGTMIVLGLVAGIGIMVDSCWRRGAERHQFAECYREGWPQKAPPRSRAKVKSGVVKDTRQPGQWDTWLHEHRN